MSMYTVVTMGYGRRGHLALTTTNGYFITRERRMVDKFVSVILEIKKRFIIHDNLQRITLPMLTEKETLKGKDI